MPDWNELKRPFRDALIAAFNWQRLSVVLNYHGDRRLDLITSPNAGFEQNVDDVIADAERNGWLEELAKGALAENETHSGLKATVPQILAGVEAEGKAYYQRSAAAGSSQAGGDTTTVGNISNAAGVAIGTGAQVNVHNYYGKSAERERPRLDYEPELVQIPAGPFLMGSDNANPEEAPLHRVELETYAICRYPITNEQFARFVWDTGRVADKALRWQGNEPPEDKLNHPVSGVTWYEALAYCEWLEAQSGRTYRLPNEAQWEKAARGEDGRRYPWGNEWQEGRCNTGDDFTAVDAFAAQNAYGCYDMAGNAREWTLTAWGKQMSAPDRAFAYPWQADRRNDPDLPSTIWRIYRGGRFSEPAGYRCSARGAYLPDKRGPKSNRHGFRVVLLPS